MKTKPNTSIKFKVNQGIKIDPKNPDKNINQKERIQVIDKIFKPLISEKVIRQRVDELAKGVQEYVTPLKGEPIFICLLSGAFMFYADLIRQIDKPIDVVFVQWKSYVGTGSSEIKRILDLKPDIVKIEGRDVIIIEDIVDTGKSMDAFLNYLKGFKPKSVKLVALLLKPGKLEKKIDIDFLGFEIGNEFILGYGIDYNERGRNLRCIYQFVEDAKK